MPRDTNTQMQKKGQIVTQTAERTAQSGRKSACLGRTFEF